MQGDFVRIAVSGTHCSGKSTLIEDFLAAHADFVHEPEPYEWLVDFYGESMSAEPEAYDFYRQLEISTERLCGYPPGSRMIAERSPIDFLAYLRAWTDLRRSGDASDLMETSLELVRAGMQHVDLLVVLPLDDSDRIVVPEDEDLELRSAMDDQLLELIHSDELAPLIPGHLRIVEARGARDTRLAAIERAIRGG